MTGPAGLSLPLAFLAGLLTFLSPCVLPLLPIVLGSAGRDGRSGPAALAAGVVTSFTGAGLLLATSGAAAGLAGGAARPLLGIAISSVALTLLLPGAEHALERALAPASRWASARADRLAIRGTPGRFALGLLLGVAWSPCVGPTLGAATVLAGRGQDLGAVATTMTVFAIGAALPLLLVGTATQATIARLRTPLLAGGRAGRRALGVALLPLGAAIATGFDHAIEAALVGVSPDWLVRLTTAY